MKKAHSIASRAYCIKKEPTAAISMKSDVGGDSEFPIQDYG